MVDTLIRHMVMVLIIWQVIRCYQHWVLAQASLERLGRQQVRQVRRRQAKVSQGLTKKPTCASCESEERHDSSARREPPPRLEPNAELRPRRRSCIATGLRSSRSQRRETL